MLKNRPIRLVTIGLATACGMSLYEALKHVVGPNIGIWLSHFITVAFVTFLVVSLDAIVLRRDQRSQCALSVESNERYRAEAMARSEAAARGQIEVQLRKSEERIAMAVEAAKIGFFEWDCMRDQQTWSSTAKQLLGLSPDSPADMVVLMNAVLPEDREGINKALARTSPADPEFTYEHRALWSDGSMHWIWIRGRAFFGLEGQRLKISGIAMNIDERKQAEERLRLLAAALQEAGNAVVLTDNQGAILWVNRAFTHMTGYAGDEVIGRNPRILRSGEQDTAFYRLLWNTITAGEVWHGEIVNRKKDGSLYPEEMTIAPVRSQSGTISHFVGIKQDISERKLAEKALQAAEAKYRSIFENAVLGIWQTRPNGEFITVNPALAKMAGFSSPEEFQTHYHSAIQLYGDLRRRNELLHQLRTQTEVRDFELDVTVRGGRQRTILLNMRALTDEKGEVYHEGTVQDITDRKAAEERVRFLAYHDALTGLPNRTSLEDLLANALVKANARGETLAVIWIDLDNFKIINNSLGHAIGDLLLKEVGQRLQDCINEPKSVARVGGDEFACVLTDSKGPSRAKAGANRIRQELKREFVIQGHLLPISCSIGISLFPDHGTDSDALLRNADLAMYSAKDSGRNSIRFFAPELNARVVERLDMERQLQAALGKHEFSLVYQPLVNIATEEIIGAEALLRWHNAELGEVAPSRFIELAENNGLIIPIGEWVLNAACAQLRRWHEMDLPIPSIAVNVSAAQLLDDRFLQLVRKVLAANRLAAQHLELEITEGVLLSHTSKTLSVLEALAGLGLRLSIDDFGTGYSSLSYLKDLPVYKLKIDRSFIRTMAETPRNAELAATIIRMGKGLNLKVIAEGVETKEQLAFLRAHQCDEAQGYYFSKPLPADEFASLLLSRSFSPSILQPHIEPATLVYESSTRGR